MRKTVRRFAENELGPISHDIDRDARFPREVIEKMRPLNYFGLQVPKKYGGAELDTISYAITIEEITDHANLGRTTFYLHYQSKDDLLLDHHAAFTSQLNLDRLSREQLLGDEPQPELVEFLQQISQGKAVYLAFTQARDADIIMRNIRRHLINNLLASLQEAFPDTVPDPPADILTQYLVRAQLSLIDWWITNRTGYSAELMAATLHRLQSTVVRDAYGKQT